MGITKERHHYHSAKVTVSYPEGYGVVIGEERSKETGYEVLYCNEGTWENQFGLTKYTETGPMTMECSVCYDAYAHEWTDEKGNTCLYYKSRPMECNENQGAIDNCRVSCRSCRSTVLIRCQPTSKSPSNSQWTRSAQTVWATTSGRTRMAPVMAPLSSTLWRKLL